MFFRAGHWRRALGIAVLAFVGGCADSSEPGVADSGLPAVADGAGDTGSLSPDAADGAHPLEAAAADADAETPDGQAAAACMALVTSTDASIRHTVPWALTWKSDAGTPDRDGGSDAGDGGSIKSGCARSSTAVMYDVRTCSGNTIVHKQGDALTLTFDDQSTLTWTPSLVTSPVAPPKVVDGQSVWVAYAEQDHVMCPVCGAYTTAEIQIRTEQAGTLLWVGRQGRILDDVSDTLVRELFGVGVREQAVCSYTSQEDCHYLQRTLFERVLETSPEQLVRHAAVQQVTTPKGRYEIFWGHSVEVNMPSPIQLCLDGADPASATGFAASLL
jgi:hypothetical protein